MADALKRLGGTPTALGTSAATIYTVPGATSCVVRQIHVCNESGADADFTLSVGTDGAGKRLFKGQKVLANDSFDWTGSLPLAAAEVLQALASATTSLTITVSGVESS